MNIVHIVVFLAMPVTGYWNSSHAQEEAMKDANFLANQGYSAASEKRFPLALACFKKALAIDKDNADVYFARSGILAHEKNDYPAAITDLTQVLRLRPKNYSALFNRGLYKESTRDFDGAIKDYTQVLDPDADFSNYGGTDNEAKAHTLHYRGRVYQWHKKNYELAAADYTAALKLDPSLKRIYYRRAQCFHGLNKYRSATSDFDMALEHEPTYPNLLNAYAWLLATCPVSEFRDGKRALELAEKTKSNTHLAAAHAELGDFDSAIDELDSLVASLKRSKRDYKDRIEKSTEYLALLKHQAPIRD